MASVTRSIGRSSVGRLLHSSHSAVVEHTKRVKRVAIHQPCSTCCANSRRIPHRLGCSPTRSDSSGSLGHQTPESPHQLPRASSCSPSVESISTSPHRQSCLSLNWHYDSHVLCTITGGRHSTIVTPLSDHLPLGNTSQKPTVSGTSSGHRQRFCRPPQQYAATSPRVGTPPRDLLPYFHK